MTVGHIHCRHFTLHFPQDGGATPGRVAALREILDTLAPPVESASAPAPDPGPIRFDAAPPATGDVAECMAHLLNDGAACDQLRRNCSPGSFGTVIRDIARAMAGKRGAR